MPVGRTICKGRYPTMCKIDYRDSRREKTLEKTDGSVGGEKKGIPKYRHP